MGRKVVYLPTCHSTNDYAFELLRKSDIESGTIVITDHQTRGKGQRGNTWLAEPGKNITCSIIYRPLNMPAAEQFRLNIILSVAIFIVLGKRALPKLKIKWPNDIYVKDQKLGGVLIESTLQGSKIDYCIIGIGINVNQEKFEFRNATSIKQQLEIDTKIEELVSEILTEFELLISEFLVSGIEKIKEKYITNLFRFNEWHLFEDVAGEFEGRIVGITDIGEILIEQKLGLMKYGMKEFRYII